MAVGKGSRVRSCSAPVTVHGRDPLKCVACDEEYRTSAEYAQWYYSQHPKDPRLPPPVVTCRTYLAIHKAREGMPSMEYDEHTPVSQKNDVIPSLVEDKESCGSSVWDTPAHSSLCHQSDGYHRMDPSAEYQPSTPSAPGWGTPPVYTSTHIAYVDLYPHADMIMPDTPAQWAPSQGWHQSEQSFLEQVKSARLTGHPKFTVHDLVGHYAELSQDQEGSRLIQKLLDSGSSSDCDLVYNEVAHIIQQLTHDVFGNYIVQKLLEHGSDEVREYILNDIYGHVLEISVHQYGCRIIQKALDVCCEKDRVRLAGELRGHVARLVQDQNGNHVIQKCIEVMPSSCGFVVEAFRGRVCEFATHAYGCRVVQRILEFCSQSHEIVPVLEEILLRVHQFVADQYGNYVVQHVIANGHPQYRYAITSRLRGHYAVLSMHKYASNVVEKMFEHADQQLRDTILEELFKATPRRDDGLSGMGAASMDQYGNYVVQKIFDYCAEEQRVKIILHLQPFFPILRRAPYAKHFVSLMEKHSVITSQPRRKGQSLSPPAEPLSPPCAPRSPPLLMTSMPHSSVHSLPQTQSTSYMTPDTYYYTNDGLPPQSYATQVYVVTGGQH